MQTIRRPLAAGQRVLDEFIEEAEEDSQDEDQEDRPDPRRRLDVPSDENQHDHRAGRPLSPGAEPGEDGDGQVAKKRRVVAKRAPRPKLTVATLQGPMGFDHISKGFPATFQSQFKGHGYEVGDLRRLLEMYSRWQTRIFPHGSFDDFIGKLEKLSASNMLKNELRQLRQNLIQIIVPPEPEEDNMFASGDHDTASPGEGHGSPATDRQHRSPAVRRAPGDDGLGDDSESDVPAASMPTAGPMDMAPSASAQVAPPAAPPMVSAVAMDEDDEDDELVMMMREQAVRQNEEDAALAAVPDDFFDDDDFGPVTAKPQPAQTAVTNAAAASPKQILHTASEDEGAMLDSDYFTPSGADQPPAPRTAGPVTATPGCKVHNSDFAVAQTTTISSGGEPSAHTVETLLSAATVAAASAAQTRPVEVVDRPPAQWTAAPSDMPQSASAEPQEQPTSAVPDQQSSLLQKDVAAIPMSRPLDTASGAQPDVSVSDGAAATVAHNTASQPDGEASQLTTSQQVQHLRVMMLDESADD